MENKPVPTDLAGIADQLLAHARERMADGHEFTVVAYLYRRSDHALIEFAIEQVNGDKDDFVRVIRQIAGHEQPDAIFLLSEGWALPPELADQTRAMYDRYGSLSNCPEAHEILLLAVETYAGHWLGTGRIETRGRARRAAPITLESAQPIGGGNFENLLPARAG